MIDRQTGIVKNVRQLDGSIQEASVDIDGQEAMAYAFTKQTGEIRPGDVVLLNTTAEKLGLGSGGYHFVMANLNGSIGGKSKKDKGHIMKLRYTPFQLRVLAVEEEDSPFHEKMSKADSLSGIPVISGSLHSMLIPCVCGIKAVNESIRTAYVMTDGGALPISLSRAVRALKEHGLLCGTVTVGHSFGGDCEAVNLYSGLLAAAEILRAQIIIVLMGPGVVGTGTKWGHTGLEVGQIINAIYSLKGISYTIPRISFADKRKRHCGLSHHTLTALADVSLGITRLVLPELDSKQKETVLSQLEGREITKHQLVWGRGEKGIELAEQKGFAFNHMGRTYREDPVFFLAAAAAGEAAAREIQNDCRVYD